MVVSPCAARGGPEADAVALSPHRQGAPKEGGQQRARALGAADSTPEADRDVVRKLASMVNKVPDPRSLASELAAGTAPPPPAGAATKIASLASGHGSKANGPRAGKDLGRGGRAGAKGKGKGKARSRRAAVPAEHADAPPSPRSLLGALGGKPRPGPAAHSWEWARGAPVLFAPEVPRELERGVWFMSRPDPPYPLFR